VREHDAPADRQLHAALTEVLTRAGVGAPLRAQRIGVPQRSTFPLEKLSVSLRDGQELLIAFKRLEWSGLRPDARLSKPTFTFESSREPAVYASVLPLAPAGPPRFLGSLPSDSSRGRWLFLEWVEARELHQIGSIALWAQAARWLARMHAALAKDLERHAREAALPTHDAAYCRRWAQRACEFAHVEHRDGEGAGFLKWLLNRYDAVVEELLDQPQTVIHGDFYASNVLIGEGPGQAPAGGEGSTVRVAPVDWEMAAVGSGLLDLASLASGDWSEHDREAMWTAYAETEGVPPFNSRALQLARLHHAVQRLGWAPPGWSAPESQRHDWLAEAMMLAETLEV
jgi:aminoglycoside phosphotransferase (APT) family kinase protein